MLISRNLILKQFSKALLGLFLFQSCATFKTQHAESAILFDGEQKPTHTFYLAGGLGNLDKDASERILSTLRTQLEASNVNSTLIFTGDNVSMETKNWKGDKILLRKQLDLVKNFSGKTIFIPGNNEWKSYKSEKLERTEDFIKDLDKDRINFFPENACPLERRVINEDLDLILVDSKWFISNWSRIENINKKCTNVNTRRRFIQELEGYINDGQGKNIVIAMHHPVLSNGEYAGHITAKQHLLPLPFLGTLRQTVNDLGAFNPDNLNSRYYNYMRIMVSSLAQASDRITIVSGHEESLQYLSGGDLHQIVSGSLGKASATNRGKDRITAIGGSLLYEGVYTAGKRGFSKLEYFADGSSKVTMITDDTLDKEDAYQVLPKFKKKKKFDNFEISEETTKKQAVLTDPKDYDKSGLHKFLWGDRYRKFYAKEVTAPVVKLDTLYGGLKVTKEGGGHQSFSLRLEDKKGKEYAMRSLKKNALKFLKFKLPGLAYNEEDYKDTFAEDVISDFFTTAHPYLQLAVNPLAKAAGVNHSDSDLFYVPKQASLEEYNKSFGDELYFVERRPSEEQTNYKGYKRTIDETGKVTDVESSTDMLEKIKSDESYTVDQHSYIRARVFDMLIGDWDRHQDQWRWLQFENNAGHKEFMPVPRDRDNAFPKFDGFAMKVIKLFVPLSRSWQTFDADIDNLKWINNSGYPLDRSLLTKLGAEAWEQEAKIIQEQITSDVIENAFSKLPPEVNADDIVVKIKKDLMERLKTLPGNAKKYGEFLNRSVAITATEKDDVIEITRMPEGQTKVVIKRLLSDEKNEKIYERTFRRDETKELLIYGLGDDDVFMVTGEADKEIMVRIIGGYGDDTFIVENKKRLKVYEWEHEKTNFGKEKPKVQLSDLYKTNNYHFTYFKNNTNILAPKVGFRTDDGFFLGFKDTYVKRGLNGNSFRQKHSFAGSYYFGFESAELDYQGVFGNIFPKWNLEVNGYYTGDKFTNNFFGRGNETVNQEDALDRDFYRARLQQYRASVGLAFYSLRIKALFESLRVNEATGRFFNPTTFDPIVFEQQRYLGAEVMGKYKNGNAGDFPTKALQFGFSIGYKANVNLNNNNFGYASLNVGVDHKLIPSGNLVLATRAEYKSLVGGGNTFFYHAPSLGGDNGLRGFRDQRFTGRSYLYHSTDLKVKLKRYITAVSPVTIGLYGGFDYGRVWERNENSNIWHTSQGVGFWISSLKALTLNLGYFNSKENNLVQFGFGLSL
ncbi:ShlB/FhaC/HecB family hemolysin secretion/activation protein [Ulvibacterium marinum]|uniref:Haemolysin activator HlyB C-terminal domain-containing protein n=1 Tax=Ulvibacterium marinum TaxID=2419782 RepID=A0A3B0BZI9_9FLAO|nr:metallophosphoesterase [Ulvibacterium marinum]RKN78702.1 hypothetical protein D7Z94_21140 [Ulvibacterium marinum]